MNIHSTIEAAFHELAKNNLERVFTVANDLCGEQNVTGFWLRGLSKDLMARRQLNRGDEKAVAEIERDFEAAIDDYSRVIDAAKTHWLNTALARRGQLYIALKRYQKAVKDLNTVIKREPQNWRAIIHRGIACMRRYDYDAAIEDFDRVLLMNDPSNVQVLEALERKGEVALQCFKYDQAFFYFDSAEEFCEEQMALIQMKIMGSLSLFLKKDYDTAAELMAEIEPQLMEELDNDNARQHLQKFERLQHYLQSQLIEQPMSEEEMQAQHQLFRSERTSGVEKCHAFFKLLMNALLVIRLRVSHTPVRWA